MINPRALRLYLCTDRTLLKGRALLEAVEAAISGGVTLVQLREKELPARDFFSLAKEMLNLTNRYNVPLIINDRLDIALAVGAAGVHLGQEDLPLKAARRLAGNDFIIGVSARNLEAALTAELEGADYLGCGAVFPTGTKKAANVIGPEGLAAVVSSVRIPVVGIGGIGLGNAAEVMAAGAAGIAVISAILSLDDIRAAAAELRAIVNNEQLVISNEREHNK
jgi:thiamine-phosphate pyrophosphorylase